MTMIYQIRYTVVKSSLEEMKMSDLSVQPADTGAPPTYPYHTSVITNLLYKRIICHFKLISIFLG